METVQQGYLAPQLQDKQENKNPKYLFFGLFLGLIIIFVVLFFIINPLINKTKQLETPKKSAQDREILTPTPQRLPLTYVSGTPKPILKYRTVKGRVVSYYESENPTPTPRQKQNTTAKPSIEPSEAESAVKQKYLKVF